MIEKQGDNAIIFDFEAADFLTLTESIKLLAFFSKGIIVDLSNTNSVPAELQAIITTHNLPILPVINIELTEKRPYALFQDLYVNDQMVDLVIYKDSVELKAIFEEAIHAKLNIKYNGILVKKEKIKYKRMAIIEKLGKYNLSS